MTDAYRRSPAKAKIYFYLIEFGSLLFKLCALGMAYYFLHQHLWANIVIGCILFFQCLNLLTKPYIAYRCYRYTYNQRYIAIERKLFFKHVHIFKYERIQNVKIVQNVLMRYFKLYHVHIDTAGTTLQLPLVSFEEAQRIEAQCMTVLRGVDSDI